MSNLERKSKKKGVTNIRRNIVKEEKSNQINKGNETPVNKCSCETLGKEMLLNIYTKITRKTQGISKAQGDRSKRCG